jgi:FtsP/CotA-like multicopper oxidase with cupredoxin domain
MAGVTRSLAASTALHVADSPAPKLSAPGLSPERLFERRMFTDGVLALPNGARLPYWGFEDPIGSPGRKSLPSPAIRVREGETAQFRLEMQKATASRCQSSLPSSAAGAAAGATASDALQVTTYNTHIYQWTPRASGTWLYQSHSGTPLDFEMGLFGLLVVDPAPDTSGRTLAFKNGPSYDVEKFWVLDDIDPVWHEAQHASRHFKRQGDGQALTDAPFNSKYFLINGVPNVEVAHHRDVAIEAEVGQKVLIRLLNASYSLVKISIEHFHGSIISVDGRAIDPAQCPWTSWIPVLPARPLFMATGSRHDLLIDLDPAKNPAVRGTSYKVVIEYLDLAKRTIRNAHARDAIHVGRAETTITIM